MDTLLIIVAICVAVAIIWLFIVSARIDNLNKKIDRLKPPAKPKTAPYANKTQELTLPNAQTKVKALHHTSDRLKKSPNQLIPETISHTDGKYRVEIQNFRVNIEHNFFDGDILFYENERLLVKVADTILISTNEHIPPFVRIRLDTFKSLRLGLSRRNLLISKKDLDELLEPLFKKAIKHIDEIFFD